MVPAISSQYRKDISIGKKVSKYIYYEKITSLVWLRNFLYEIYFQNLMMKMKMLKDIAVPEHLVPAALRQVCYIMHAVFVNY